MIVLFHLPSYGDNVFQTYFTGQALRIDFYQTGDKDHENIIIDDLYLETQWAGNPSNLIDTLNLGHYIIKVYSLRTNELIFSYGFGTLFMEWQTTAEAYAGKRKVMGNTLRIPFPRDSIQVRFYKRDSLNTFEYLINQFIIDPSSKDISREDRAAGPQIIPIQPAGLSADQVELVILGEG